MSEDNTIPLHPNQAWFLEEKRPSMLAPGQFAIGQMFAMPLGASAKDVQAAVDAVCRTNEQLRASFSDASGQWVQQVKDHSAPAPFITVPLLDIPPEDRESFIDRVAQSVPLLLNIDSGALLHFVYFDLGPDRRSRLLILAHHLVVDLYSMRIIEADLLQAFRDLRSGRNPELAPRASLADCTYAIADYIQAEAPFMGDLLENSASLSCGTLVAPPTEGRPGLGLLNETKREVANYLPRALRELSGTSGAPFTMEQVAMVAAGDAVTSVVGNPTWMKLMHNGRSLRRNRSDNGRVLPSGSLRTVGWFATAGLYRFTPRGSKGFRDYLSENISRLSELPNQGVDLAFARWMMPPADRSDSAIRIWNKARAMFNYMSISSTAKSEEVEKHNGNNLRSYSDALESRLDLDIVVQLDGMRTLLKLYTNPILVEDRVVDTIADSFHASIIEMSDSGQQ